MASPSNVPTIESECSAIAAEYNRVFKLGSPSGTATNNGPTSPPTGAPVPARPVAVCAVAIAGGGLVNNDIAIEIATSNHDAAISAVVSAGYSVNHSQAVGTAQLTTYENINAHYPIIAVIQDSGRTYLDYSTD